MRTCICRSFRILNEKKLFAWHGVTPSSPCAPNQYILMSRRTRPSVLSGYPESLFDFENGAYCTPNPPVRDMVKRLSRFSFGEPRSVFDSYRHCRNCSMLRPAFATVLSAQSQWIWRHGSKDTGRGLSRYCAANLGVSITGAGEDFRRVWRYRHYYYFFGCPLFRFLT
jgi:hypothetical protein